jgi:serum/glucocorticoid-regulated kinase 2
VQEDGIEIDTNLSDGHKINVDDFDIIKVLGKGSFGKVMLVKKKNTSEVLAMKSMRKKMLVKRKQIGHTQTERRIAQNLKSPFLVNLRYAFQTPEKLYLVLDYCSGGELFFWLRQHRRFSQPRVKLYCAQMTAALEVMHGSDIIYRDLKPENILVGADGCLKLTDFGLAKEDVQGFSSDGGAKTFCGTPEYLAPEVLQNTPHGKGVDWWAMGTLAYEMMYGLPPFYDENMQKMYRKILKNELEWKGPLKKPAFADARDFLDNILKKNADERLGCNGIEEIKTHPWFASEGGSWWSDVENKKIPVEFVPPHKDELDTSNFDDEFTREAAEDSVVPENEALSEAQTRKARFSGFTFNEGSGFMD